MKSFLLACVCFISVTGCLKQVTPSGNSNAQSNAITGAIVMRDWHGRAIEKPDGHVMAQFTKSGVRASSLEGGLKLPYLSHPQKSAVDGDRAVTRCEIIKEPKTPKPENRASATVTVGKVSFGTSSNDLVSLTEGENHLYKLDLQPNFTSGIYFTTVEGTKTTPNFSVKMSMPERMSHVIVQGQDFETSATAFRKTEPLRLSWDSPTGDLDLKINQMELEIISDTATETVSLICGVVEKDLMVGSQTITWDIPVTYLQSLNATTSAFVILKRGQWMRASSPDIGVISFEGVRVYATQALIAE
ncbi:MAG: hypothetical protein NT000_05845 [Proteobacteria bacterium]|nr:hypothetical protein [Pseudomonadota bacterium]